MPRKTAKIPAEQKPIAAAEVLHAAPVSSDAQTAMVVRSAMRRGELVGGKQEVKKHVAAIHTSGELGLVERKLVNILLLNAYDELATARQHRLPTKMLMAMLGWAESDDTVGLKKSLLQIVTTPVEFDLMETGDSSTKKPRWTATALLASADLVNGFCEYEYSTRLAEELADPDVYAIINVGIQRQFKSGYALTLYENCVRFRRTESTGWMTVEIFRKLMGATSPTYDDFRRLSELVINKAVKEVNKVSDIEITAEYERKGRKVTRIRFAVVEKAQQTIFTENENRIEEVKAGETFKRLRAHAIGEKLAIAWVLTDEPRAKAALDITEQRARGGQIKSNTGGYVRRLIEDMTIDLAGTAFDQQLEAEAAAARSAAASAATQKEQEEAARQARNDRIRALVDGLSTEEMKAYASEYIKAAGAEKATSYDASTGIFRKAMEKVPFLTWLRPKVAQKNGLGADPEAPAVR